MKILFFVNSVDNKKDFQLHFQMKIREMYLLYSETGFVAFSYKHDPSADKNVLPFGKITNT